MCNKEIKRVQKLTNYMGNQTHPPNPNNRWQVYNINKVKWGELYKVLIWVYSRMHQVSVFICEGAAVFNLDLFS